MKRRNYMINYKGSNVVFQITGYIMLNNEEDKSGKKKETID